MRGHRRLQNDEWAKLGHAVGTYTYDGHCFMHRVLRTVEPDYDSTFIVTSNVIKNITINIMSMLNHKEIVYNVKI